ncbi:MAG TPA: hypothetical protein VL332_04915 [Candidatus Saccharimonadaceae bacterium]|jgi:hypothetical protein|nr:hypothetical protein [Candidatus Saccharimonadaceae bacterium]
MLLRWLAACTLLCALVWSSASAARAATVAPWHQTAFLIGGNCPLGVSDTSVFRKLDNAGLDFVVPVRPGGWATQADAITAARALAQQASRYPGRFHLRTLSVVWYEDCCHHPDPHSLTHSYRPLEYRASIEATLDSLMMPSVLGYFVWDEPCSLSTLAAAMQMVKLMQSYPSSIGKLAYVNLLPAYAADQGPFFARSFGATKNVSFPAYLSTYLDSFDSLSTPAVLSTDQYPFQVPGKVRTDYFLTLRHMREKSRKHRRSIAPTPVWQWVQLSPIARAGIPAPTITQVRWQVYAALAYGVKGIGYWTLAPTGWANGNYGPGILTATGDTTSMYSAIRALDAEIHRLGPSLMRCDPVASVHARGLGWEGVDDEVVANAARAGKIVRGFGGDADSILVGCLKDRVDGDDYLLVMNKSLALPKTFSISLGKTAGSIARIDRTTGRDVVVGRRTSTLRLKHLAAGDGELFRLGRR